MSSEDRNRKVGFGCFTVVLVAAALPLAGHVWHLAWNWFPARLFGWPTLGMWDAGALALMLATLRYKRTPDEEIEETLVGVWKAILFLLVFWLLLWVYAGLAGAR